MPRIISPEEKISVIGDWLDGETRENIAVKHNIGSGTVYNIVQQWSNRIGLQKANVLRVLAVKLKKNGLTASDCSKGFRMIMIVKKYGIQEDQLEDGITYFLKEIYLKCQELKLTPQKAFIYIYDINNFSKELPLSQIPQFLKEKKKEKEELEISIQDLYQKIKELEDIQKEKEQEIQRLSEIAKKKSRDYRLFSIAKFELAKYGIAMENLGQFVECVKGIAKENYDVTKVLELIRDYENLLNNIQLYKKDVEGKKDELNLLNQEINSRKALLDSYRIKSDIAEDLERMGFGINELRNLYDNLMEIGRENNTENKTFEQVKKEFFDDLKSYGEILGSRNERDRLKNELKNLKMQVIKERERCNSYPKVIQSLERLSNVGIYEDDIVEIEKIISMAGIRMYKDKSRYKQDLMDDFQKHGNLMLAIKNLKGKQKVLKSRKKTRNQKKKQRKNISTTKDKIQEKNIVT
jgi:hypothetical protein